MLSVVPHVARSDGMTVFFTNPPQAYAKKSWHGSAAGSIQVVSMPVCASGIPGAGGVEGTCAVVTGGNGNGVTGGAEPHAASRAREGKTNWVGERLMAGEPSRVGRTHRARAVALHDLRH